MQIGHNSVVRGSFADFKTVKTRGVCQLIIEVPIESADHALTVLGGVPQAKAEQWVGIAPVTAPEAPAETERPKGGERARRAGILCNDPTFQIWVQARAWRLWQMDYPANTEGAAEIVRANCNVQSRAELDHDEAKGRIFDQIVSEFYASQRGETDAALMEQRR